MGMEASESIVTKSDESGEICTVEVPSGETEIDHF